MATKFFDDLHIAATQRECSKIYTVYTLFDSFPDWSFSGLVTLSESLRAARVKFVDSLRLEEKQVKGEMRSAQFHCPYCHDKYCSRAELCKVVYVNNPNGK